MWPDIGLNLFRTFEKPAMDAGLWVKWPGWCAQHRKGPQQTQSKPGGLQSQ
jgi:hypothetical protein